MKQGWLRRWWLLALVAGVLMIAALAGTVLASGAVPGVHGQEDSPGQPIIIRWSTESEVDTAGYNIYRSLGEDGPWEKINARLIPGSPDPLRGGSYVFTDTKVIAGQSYWYELEEVELNGRATRLERIQATAEPQQAVPAATIPCVGSLLLAAGLGIVLTGPEKLRRASQLSNTAAKS